MIGHFPDPLPGELMYSVLARFEERMNYPARYRSSLELFGVRHGFPAIELPNRLDQLVSALPPGTTYTSDSFIARNTLLPFYAPFLPERNYEMIVENMKGDGVRTTQLRAGIIAGRVSPPEFFRTCPVCDQENLERYGETYWKRQHQIRGVEVCATHSVFLESTNIRLRGSCRRDSLISAQSAQRVSVPRKVDAMEPGNQALLHMAESAAWLLDQNASRPGLSHINQGYRQLLDSQGCLSPKGWIRLQRLREKVTECFPPEWLKIFNCELRDAGDGGWLGRLLRETEQAIAPLCHLIVLAALNVSAQEFFTRRLPESAAKRHGSLYPCLNGICPRSGTPVIVKFELKRRKHGFARIYECPHCGHRSSRAADGRSVIKVVSFGELWEQKLKALWADRSLSLRSVASQLNADARSILNYAAKLGLEFPRRGPSRLTTRPGFRVIKRAPPAMAIDAKRIAWLKFREKHPQAGISDLQRLASDLYTWLYRHDRQWMLENSPASRTCVPKNDRVDWGTRDRELVDRVIETAVRINNDSGRPRRVSVRSIGLELRVHTLLQIHKDKLPLTKAALDAHVESTEQFTLRRIRWTVETLRLQGAKPTRSDIMRVAGIGSRALKMSSVPQAIARAKEELECLPEGASLVKAA